MGGEKKASGRLTHPKSSLCQGRIHPLVSAGSRSGSQGSDWWKPDFSRVHLAGLGSLFCLPFFLSWCDMKRIRLPLIFSFKKCKLPRDFPIFEGRSTHGKSDLWLPLLFESQFPLLEDWGGALPTGFLTLRTTSAWDPWAPEAQHQEQGHQRQSGK